MWNRLVERLTLRAAPRFDDPDHDRIAAEATEAGIRYAATTLGLAALVLCVGMGAVLAGLLLVSPATPAPDAVRSSRALGAENAQLRVAYRDVQRERDSLMERLAEIESATRRDQGKPGAIERPPVTIPTHAVATKPTRAESIARPAAVPAIRVPEPVNPPAAAPAPPTDAVRCIDGTAAANISECPERVSAARVDVKVNRQIETGVNIPSPTESNAPPMPLGVLPQAALRQQVAPDPPTSR